MTYNKSGINIFSVITSGLKICVMNKYTNNE